MQSLVIRLFIISFLLLPVWSYADLYFWTDGNGIKHFSNDPPENFSGELRETEEFVQDEKEFSQKEIESFDHPKESGGLRKSALRQKRAGSRPKVDIEFEYYDFASANIDDIRNVMWKKSPIRYNGKSYCAYTNTRIKYNFYTSQEEGAWYIDSVDTTVFVTFTMPKWTDYKKANRDQQKKWDAFFKSLMDHENGHKDIAIKAAKTIENELLKFNFPNEDQLKNAAETKAQMILRNSRIWQQQYDFRTEHGLKTGVVLH